MLTQINLGDEIDFKGGRWRVIRFINDDHTLFESEEGVYVITETYLQLKSPEGHIDFMLLTSERTTYTGSSSTIKALDPIQWRKQ